MQSLRNSEVPVSEIAKEFGVTTMSVYRSTSPPESVYTIYAVVHGQTAYVGKTKNLSLRISNHVRGALQGPRTAAEQWFADLMSEGIWPHIKVLQEGITESVTLEESSWVEHYVDEGYIVLNVKFTKNSLTSDRQS
jgi:hypothetical protein